MLCRLRRREDLRAGTAHPRSFGPKGRRRRPRTTQRRGQHPVHGLQPRLWVPVEQPRSGAGRTGGSATRWVADSARQIDYWVTAGAPAQVLGRYADVTGHAPVLPGWAAGLWQSKLRYRTQDELLDVAREYCRRDLPLSVIVVDFFHWTQLGDWQFEPASGRTRVRWSRSCRPWASTSWCRCGRRSA